MRPFSDPFLCIITDETLDAAAITRVIDDACTDTRPTVQLRMRSMCGAEVYRLTERLRTVTRARGCALLVHDRIDVALAVDADGVHLPGAGMASMRARALIGPDKRLGRSVHSLEEIAREKALGAVDYLQFGPVFATPSKAAYGEPQGLERLANAVARAAPIPIVAVGGISLQNAAEAIRAGARGAAVIAAVMRAAAPRTSARELAATLDAARAKL